MIRFAHLVIVLAVCASAQTAIAQFGYSDLADRRLVLPKPKVTLPKIDPCVKSDYTPIWLMDEANKRSLLVVRSALDKPIATVDYHELSLNDCLKDLQLQTGVRFVIDERALADASVTPDVLVSCRLNQAALRTVLNTLLHPLGLDWYPGQEGLIISTKEEAETTQFTVIYPVWDLIGSPEGADFDTLITLIAVSVSPNCWHEGTGPITEMRPLNDAGALMVQQTWEVQQGIMQLLDGLRQAKTQQGIVGTHRVPIEGEAKPTSVTKSTATEDVSSTVSRKLRLQFLRRENR